MPDTDFHAFARQRAQTLLNDLATETADAARAQLAALRAELDARIGSLDEAVAPRDYKAAIDRLAKELADTARSEADARVEAVRTEAAKQAETARADAESHLATARSEAATQAEAAQTVNMALLRTIDEAREQLKAAQSAAQEAAKHAQDDFEKRLAAAQAAHAALERSLADLQRDASATKAERDAQAASLVQAQKQIRKLEQEQNRLRLTCDESSKLLDVQIRRASELAVSLETAKEEAAQVQTDADARAQDLARATERIAALERERKTVDEAAVAAHVPSAAPEGEDAVAGLLDGVVGAIQSIQRASSANEVLDVLIDQLGLHFDNAAIFLAGPTGVKGLRGKGFGDADLSAIVLPRASDSPVIRALVDREAVSIDHGPAPNIGLPRGPIARAIALPVVSGGRVIAVAYAEDAERSARALPGIGRRIAEMLIDHASRRLTTKRPSTAGSTKASSGLDTVADSAAHQNGHKPTPPSAAARASSAAERGR